MYAAYRWIEENGGVNVLSIGRKETLDMYLRLGYTQLGQSFKSGDVSYELLGATISDIKEKLIEFSSTLVRMKKSVNWQLEIPFNQAANCYHGGEFFDAVGNQFDNLNRRNEIINADVLDAWFSPAPAVIETIEENLEWIARTSPPTHSEGLNKKIGQARNVSPDCILTGAGSSNLIYLAFQKWLTPSSRVLILDPSYGEYSHVLENIIKCKVERLILHRSKGYQLDLDSLSKKLKEGFDLFVWVNPNSPTGLHTSKIDVERILKETASCQRIWIDETYIDFLGINHSLESFAAQSDNVIVCKSLSKVYALSGLRAAYLCSSPQQLHNLRVLSPPWSMSLPAQIAATHALNSLEYYHIKYL
ncbi:MAG: aminotransferase class I/II-fold pyridoxal phosphate-dependent enzyme [bacterium]